MSVSIKKNKTEMNDNSFYYFIPSVPREAKNLHKCEVLKTGIDNKLYICNEKNKTCIPAKVFASGKWQF